MNKIAQALREIAEYLPDYDIGDESPFICDAVDCLAESSDCTDNFYSALAFLKELGMGSGLFEFIWTRREWTEGPNATPTEQIWRKVWLEFAAQLAEEWDVQ